VTLTPNAQVIASDAANYLGISRQLINYWRTTGKIQAIGRRGRHQIYRLADLVEVERLTRRTPQSHRRS
jgi:predicted site-specific integrase-resolvase